MLKHRDLILFGIPLTAALLLAACAVFLYSQITKFEHHYLDEAKRNVMQETRLLSFVLAPLLEQNKTADAVRFCDSFDRDTLRVTLVDSAGRVLADSSEQADSFGNHSSRREIQSAQAGTPFTSVRYSESLGKWMIYHAVPIRTEHGDYVLRAAVSTDQVRNILDFSRLNMLWALLFGGEIVFVLALYIAKRVRKPLLALQKSVGSIASGTLSTHIEIPEKGPVRELAKGVSEMAEQLKLRLAEMTAQRNERTLLFDAMRDGVLLFARDGSLIHSNRAAAALFGFSSDDSQFHLSRCQIPELIELAHESFADGAAFEREFVLARNGNERFLFVTGQPLGAERETQLLLTLTELTNLRKLESFRSDFVSNVSHEVKTPLTCILGAVEALEDDPPATQRTKLLRILQQQSMRLNDLVRDILNLAALEKKQQNPDLDFSESELDAVLENAVNLCASHAVSAGMTLSIMHNEPLRVKGDTILLEQALVNLIENAIRYSGGKTIEATLHKQDTFAVVEVRDNGIGIAPEHQKRIFERFYRVDKSRSRELGGTGLGLAIVKHTAQLHGGFAEVESSPGLGSSFRIFLPLSR